MTRGEIFLTAVDILQGGRSLEIVGEHASGRTFMLRRIREHFVTLGWHTIQITGIEAFRRAQLVALGIAGFGGVADGRGSPLVAAFENLTSHIVPGRTVIIVDDCDSLDEASWGVVSAVCSQLGVPYVSARLRHLRSHSARLPTSGFSAVYALELPAMGFAEFENTLNAEQGTRFDEATMSRLYAMSGGNIGLALVVVDAVRRSGRFVIDKRGVTRAVGALWVPSLSAVVQVILQSLSAEELSALKSISLLGPTELATISRVVPDAQISQLEDRAFVTVVHVGGRELVTINPPLIAEYFRSNATLAQQAALVAQIDSAHDDEGAISYAAPPLSRSSSAQERVHYVRLVHERASVRSLRARQQWTAHHTLANAVRFVQALQGDASYSADEVESVIDEARSLPGTPAERTDWALMYAAHLTYRAGGLDEAIAVLTEAKKDAGPESIRLDAQLSMYDTMFRNPGEVEPFADLDRSALSPAAEHEVTMARAFWFLIRGRIPESEQELQGRMSRSDGIVDWRRDACVVYIHLGMDRSELGVQLADAGLQAARHAFDAQQIRVFSFLKAVALLSMRLYDESEATVMDAVSFGLIAGEPPVSRIGLAVLGAYFAKRHGQSALMADFMNVLESTGLPDGALPGLHRALFTVRAELDSSAAKAALTARETADEMWQRGATLVSAWTYLDGLRYVPRAEDWEHARDRIAQVDCTAIEKSAQFAEALIEADSARLAADVKELETMGRRAEAVQSARLALGVLKGGTAGASGPDVEFLERTAGSSTVARTAPLVGGTLSAREREVAELMAAGLSNPMIAEALVVSVRTVESHVTRLMKKIGVQHRHEVRDYLISTGSMR